MTCWIRKWFVEKPLGALPWIFKGWILSFERVEDFWLLNTIDGHRLQKMVHERGYRCVTCGHTISDLWTGVFPAESIQLQNQSLCSDLCRQTTEFWGRKK